MELRFKVHDDVSRWVRGLDFGRSLDLQPLLVQENSEEPDGL